jgi:hypothetical protein
LPRIFFIFNHDSLAIKTFDEAKKADLDNERLPPVRGDAPAKATPAAAPSFASPSKRNPLKDK